MTEKIAAWSFSRYNTYKSCPKKAEFLYIQKMKEPSSPALERGSALHSMCEGYLKGWKDELPIELKPIWPMLEDLKSKHAVAELEFAFNTEWNPVDWFSKEAWCRIKADAMASLEDKSILIIDFKSGKLGDNGQYIEQLELYALAALLTNPECTKVITRLDFIDHGKSIEGDNQYTQADVAMLKKRWETRVNKMMNDEVYQPTPGNACRWCAFSKSKGGMCRF